MEIEDAIIFAAECHRGVVDQAGRPYIFHPLRVAMALADPRERLAAILHDVVEDAGVTVEELQHEGLDDDVAEAIDALTKREGEDYPSFIERVARNPMARAVKIADIRDNLDGSRLGLLPFAVRRRLRGKYEPALRRLLERH